jgi:hypothetical protein
VDTSADPVTPKPSSQTAFKAAFIALIVITLAGIFWGIAQRESEPPRIGPLPATTGTP